MPTNLTGSQINATYSQLLHVDGGPTATEKVVYSGTGVATALSIGTQSISATISSVSFTDPSGARNSLALGTLATQNASNVAITGGSITGVAFTGLTLVESATLATSAAAAGCNLSGSTLAAAGTDTNIDLNITPKGTGEVNLPKVDIDGGTIDATTVGASAAATVRGTTVLATQASGYATGAGGAVTQLTSRTTGVTLNKVCGEITLFAGSLSGHEADEFTLTNSEIAASDVVIVSIKSGAAAGTRKYYNVAVTSVSAGSCTISLGNIDNGTVPPTGTETLVLNFAVIKGVTS